MLKNKHFKDPNRWIEKVRSPTNQQMPPLILTNRVKADLDLRKTKENNWSTKFKTCTKLT